MDERSIDNHHRAELGVHNSQISVAWRRRAAQLLAQGYLAAHGRQIDLPS